MWKLLTRAFQRCITLYSQKWTVWPWEAIFCKKLPEKQLFGGTRIWIKWLWAAITPVQNLQISKTTTFSESSGRQLSDELSGSPLASILSERRAVTLLRGGRHGKLQKSEFFASFASPRKFCEEKFYQDRTMWKSTDSAFRICMTLGGPDDQSHSYCSSKSEEGGKSGLVTKNKGCHKKKSRPQFFFKTLFLLREVFKSNLETSLRRNKDLIKNCARVFFLWHPFSEFFFLKFDSTLTADNSGSKPPNLENYHIFGILRTSAFTWSYPGWVIPVQNFE